MQKLDNDVKSKLDELRNEVTKLLEKRPQLREKHQKILAAYTIARVLSYFIDVTRTEIMDLAFESGVPAHLIEDALGASSSRPVTLETIARVTSALGFVLQLQFIPKQGQKYAFQHSDTTSQDINDGSVIITMPFPLAPEQYLSEIRRGLKKIGRSAPKRIPYSELGVGRNQPSLEIWELLRLAERAAFDLILTFIPLNQAEDEIQRDERSLSVGLHTSQQAGHNESHGSSLQSIQGLNGI